MRIAWRRSILLVLLPPAGVLGYWLFFAGNAFQGRWETLIKHPTASDASRVYDTGLRSDQMEITRIGWITYTVKDGSQTDTARYFAGSLWIHEQVGRSLFATFHLSLDRRTGRLLDIPYDNAVNRIYIREVLPATPAEL